MSSSVLSASSNLVANARLIGASSFMQGCDACNLFDDDDASLWLSNGPCPQSVEFEIAEHSAHKKMVSFGWYCWNLYDTNPMTVELYVHRHPTGFSLIGTFRASKRARKYQIFDLERPLDMSRDRTFRVVVKSAAGGEAWTQCYINSILAFDKPAKEMKRVAPILCELYTSLPPEAERHADGEDTDNADGRLPQHDIESYNDGDSDDSALQSMVNASIRESLGDSTIDFIPPLTPPAVSIKNTDHVSPATQALAGGGEPDLGRTLAEMDWCVKRVALSRRCISQAEDPAHAFEPGARRFARQRSVSSKARADGAKRQAARTHRRSARRLGRASQSRAAGAEKGAIAAAAATHSHSRSRP